MGTVGGDGLEGESEEVGLFGAQGGEASVGLHLGDVGTSFSHAAFQPCHEAYHCHAVLYMRPLHALAFRMVLQRTPCRHGTFRHGFPQGGKL